MVLPVNGRGREHERVSERAHAVVDCKPLIAIVFVRRGDRRLPDRADAARPDLAAVRTAARPGRLVSRWPGPGLRRRAAAPLRFRHADKG